jgi:LysM domain
MLKRLLAVLTAMLLTLATFAYAAELRGDHPSTYTVVKGDTLWDISARFLTQPWLWPEIWQANPQVKNPHLIYPGDVLSLVYINGQPRISVEAPAGPQIRYGDPIDTIPLSEIVDWLKQSTIVQDPTTFPYIVGVEEDHLITSEGSVVFVKGLVDPKPGQKFQIARPTLYYAMSNDGRDGRRLGGATMVNARADRHHIHWGYGDSPQEAHGEKLGYEMRFKAQGIVTQVQGDITTVLVYGNDAEVYLGDRLLPIEDQPYCNCFTPHAAAA